VYLRPTAIRCNQTELTWTRAQVSSMSSPRSVSKITGNITLLAQIFLAKRDYPIDGVLPVHWYGSCLQLTSNEEEEKELEEDDIKILGDQGYSNELYRGVSGRSTYYLVTSTTRLVYELRFHVHCCIGDFQLLHSLRLWHTNRRSCSDGMEF
jgi:hypothetical protein